MTEEVEVVQEATAEPQEVEQVEQVENTEESTPSDTEDTGEPKRQDKGVGKRINELTREKYEAKREAEYWRQQAEQMRQPQAEKPSGKPTPDQFQTFEDYQEALVNHALSERLAKEREAKEAFEAEQRTRAAKQTWSKQEETARESFIDYDETVYPLLDIEEVGNNPFLGSAIADSPIGAKILYHLGKNPDEAVRIARLSPAATAREIGKLEARLEEQAKPKSSAPPPPKPVGGAAKAINGLRDDMPVDDWVKLRTQEARKAGYR